MYLIVYLEEMTRVISVAWIRIPCCFLDGGGSTNPNRTTFLTVITAPTINTAQFCLKLMDRGRWERKTLTNLSFRCETVQ